MNRAAQTLNLVPYAFWKPELPEVFVPNTTSQAVEEKPVAVAIQNEVFKELARASGQSTEAIKRSMNLSRDVGLDSLDIAF